MEHAFENVARVIGKRFLNRGAGDLVADIDADVVIAHGQRHIPAIDLGDQRAERFVCRAALEALQPERLLGHAQQLLVLIDPIMLRALDDDLLLLGALQFDRGTLRHADFDLAFVQLDQVRLSQFDQRPWAENHAGARNQFQGSRIGAADIGAQPIAGHGDEVRTDRRPALLGQRLGGDDALRVGHLADPAILGERIQDQELVFGNVGVDFEDLKIVRYLPIVIL